MVERQRGGSVHVGVSWRHVVDEGRDGAALAELLPVLGPVAAVGDGDAQVGAEVVVRGAHWNYIVLF